MIDIMMRGIVVLDNILYLPKVVYKLYCYCLLFPKCFLVKSSDNFERLAFKCNMYIVPDQTK